MAGTNGLDWRLRHRRRADYRRWERERPMELWQLDIMDVLLGIAHDPARCADRKITDRGEAGGSSWRSRLLCCGMWL